jgi:hypothetical protein
MRSSLCVGVVASRFVELRAGTFTGERRACGGCECETHSGARSVERASRSGAAWPGGGAWRSDRDSRLAAAERRPSHDFFVRDRRSVGEFMADGRSDTTWRPNPPDPAPWVEVVVPASARVHEVRVALEASPLLDQLSVQVSRDGKVWGRAEKGGPKVRVSSPGSQSGGRFGLRSSNQGASLGAAWRSRHSRSAATPSTRWRKRRLAWR